MWWIVVNFLRFLILRVRKFLKSQKNELLAGVALAYTYILL
jgi:hypothetical protein